jgi:endoglucanase
VKLNPSITFLDLNTEQQAFLEKLLSTPSPTGFEEAGQQIWINEVKDLADDIVTDPYGSAAARIIIDKNKPTIILEAHCDEIGMMINHITEKGFLHVTRLGGSDATIARAKRVHIHTKNGIVLGVVGNTAIHLKDSSNNKQPKWKELFIDIGVSSKEEALELVKVGNPVTYADDLEFLNEDIVVGRAIDNRIGGYIIAEAFKILAEKRDQLNVNVAVVNSVQEEIGGFGARMMTQRLNPNFALVTDVTHATDSPGINHAEHGLVKLGKGAAITHGAANHPKFVQFIEEVAASKRVSAIDIGGIYLPIAIDEVNQIVETFLKSGSKKVEQLTNFQINQLRFETFICYSLNRGYLNEFFDTIRNERELIQKYYQDITSAFITNEKLMNTTILYLCTLCELPFHLIEDLNEKESILLKYKLNQSLISKSPSSLLNNL